MLRQTLARGGYNGTAALTVHAPPSACIVRRSEMDEKTVGVCVMRVQGRQLDAQISATIDHAGKIALVPLYVTIE